MKTDTILIAAENPASAAALDGLLRGAGYENVRITSDGREIAALYDCWPFDALILDMHMRTISSLNVLEALSAHIASRALSVVAMLDEPNGWLETRVRDLGVRDMLCGALERERVLTSVSGALNRHARVA